MSGTLFTTRQYTEILDCHGDVRFFTGRTPLCVCMLVNIVTSCHRRNTCGCLGAETGSAWQSFVNGMRVTVSYLIHAPNGTVVAYVDGSRFAGDDINIIDAATSAVIANLRRDTWTLSAWTWNITAYQPQHPVADGTVLALIAGYKAFHSNSTDVCNGYFNFVAYTIGTVVLIAAGLGAYMIYRQFRRQSTSYLPVRTSNAASW